MRPTFFMLWCLLILILTSCSTTAQAPTAVEQATREYVQNRCEGVDTPCGDYRITRVKDVAVSASFQSGGVDTAWCVDYALQRINTGRYTSWFMHWANIPESVLVVKRTDGQYESVGMNDCNLTVLE